MKETKFIEQNKEKWSEFEEMLEEKRHEPAKLNDLFIQITDDLSYARTFYPNRSVRMYLNTLAQRIFHNIYRGKRFPAERLRRFWADELPQLFWEERKVLLLSFCLFALAFSIGVVSSIINPDFARIILGDGYVDMTLQNIENGDPMAVYKDNGPGGMSVSIAARNLFVAFQTAVLGVLASIGTVFILLYNGIMVGAFQYFFVEKGVFWESFLTIWIHGTLEISAIIIAGTSGLVAGSGLLFPGTYTRMQAFQTTVRRGLKIFFGIVPIIILAAFFEGFFTRYTDTPDFVRGAFIFTSLAFVLWYFVWLPWHKARTGGFRKPIGERDIPLDRKQAIDFKAIKNAGEILSDIFTALRRRPKITLWGLLGTTALFALSAFLFSEKKIADTFTFSAEPLGVLAGANDFFTNKAVSSLFYLQTVLLAGLAGAAFRVLELEMDGQERHIFPWRRVLLAALVMLLPAMGFIAHFYLEPGLWGWLLSMAFFPMLSLWCAVVYFENLNPIGAFVRTFSLMRWDQSILLGFLTVNLGILIFRFYDTQIWQITQQFFSWLVPPGEDSMRTFAAVVNTFAAGMVSYFIFLLNILGGALQYFSSREIADATTLFEGIEQVGTARQIRGLARE